MKSSALTLSLAVSILPLFSSHAALDLKQSKFTQVVNDVQVIGSDQNATPASVNGIFKVPDILRTGPNSRAELTADDQTITRVGANTVFSFDPANRTIDLQKGSVLFHSPKGRGGGTVQTGSATASVLGTTIVVTTTPDGGFKVLVLEGQAEVKFLGGLTQHLSPGQMTFILPGGGTSPIIVFRLDEQTKGSKLVNGFNHPLDSLGKINDEIDKQLNLINKDKLKDTGLEVGDSATSSTVSTIDPSVLQSYFNSLTSFKPLFNGRGYFTIDGLFIAPDSEETPPTDALFPALALSVNVVIGSAILDTRHVFLNRFDIIAPAFPDTLEFLKNPFAGFFGRNIEISTTHIDMSPYAELQFFDFVAAQDITIDGSLSLDNAEGQDIFFTAFGQIHIATGSTFSANANLLYLGSLGSMQFNAVTFNNTGDLDFATHADFGMTGGAINAGGFAHILSEANGLTLSGMTMTAGSDIYILSQSQGTGATPALSVTDSTLSGSSGVVLYGYGDVNLSGTTVNAAHGDINFTAAVASLTLNNCSLTAGTVGPITSGLQQSDPQSIIMFGQTGASFTGGSMAASTIQFGSDGDTLLDSVSLTANHLTVNALNTMTLNNMDLSALIDVNISGNTVVLTDINLGGNPNITSKTGHVASGINTHQSVVRGDINMISGVSYNGTMLSDANSATFINPSSGSGIHTHANP